MSLLYRQDLLFLLLGQLVDARNELVGALLDLIMAAPLLVLRHLLVLGERLEPVVGVAANVSHGDPRLLGELPHSLGELLSTFLGEGRHGQSDDLTVAAGREA